MKKEIIMSRNIGITDIPEPKLGETLFEVEVEGKVYGKTLIWAKDYNDARAKVDYGYDFGFIRSEDEPDEWNTIEYDESIKIYPDNEFVEYDPLDQVIYIPDHAEGDPNHEDCEIGFVVKDLGEDCFVRYWNMNQLRKENIVLRTMANSERTPKRCLYPGKFVSSQAVKNAFEQYC